MRELDQNEVNGNLPNKCLSLGSTTWNFDRRSALSSISLGAVSLALFGCDVAVFPTYRFRLTVYVDTGGGIVSGSNVYEVWSRGRSKTISFGDFDIRTIGQSTYIELSDKTLLFASLRSLRNKDWISTAFLRGISPGSGEVSELNYQGAADPNKLYGDRLSKNLGPIYLLDPI